jgi:outer membrane protein assembly factor BamB
MAERRPLTSTTRIALGILLVFLLSIQFSVVFVLQVNASSEEWPMYGHDNARTGWSEATFVNTTSAQNWEVGWTETRLDSPAVAYGYVYYKLGHVVCYDAYTGDTVWESAREASGDVWSVAVAYGYVYTDSDGYVYALDAYTGNQVWEYELNFVIDEEDDDKNDEFYAPAVANGIVYVGCGDYNLYAFDAYEGTKLWNFTTEAKVRSCPAISEGIVYFTSNDGNVYALDAGTGTKIWSYNTGRRTQYPVESSPAVADGVVYVGSANRTLCALNAFDGSKIWSASIGGIYSAPAVAYGLVYAADQDTVYAFDAVTGTQKWTFTHPSFAPEYSSPTVADGVVYIGSSGGDSYSGRFYALNAYSGAKIEEIEMASKVYSTPAVAYGMVYVASSQRLYGMSSSDFTPTFPFELVAVGVAVVVIVAVGLYVYIRKRNK